MSYYSYILRQWTRGKAQSREKSLCLASYKTTEFSILFSHFSRMRWLIRRIPLVLLVGLSVMVLISSHGFIKGG